MAISGSFKIQCPSCEGFMLIRDPKFIGKKVDCPKCKYRFVVENPAVTDKQKVAAADTVSSKKKDTAATGKIKRPPAEDVEAELEVEEETAAKPRAAAKVAPGKRKNQEVEDEPEPEARKSKKKKKKADGKSNKMLVGIVLGGVGLIVLAVAAMFMLGVFSGDSPKTAKKGGATGKGGGSGGGGSANDTPGKSKGGGDGGPTDGGSNPQFVADGSHGGVEVTNFLPANSEAVFHCKFKDFMESKFGKSAFGAGGLFSEAEFKQKLGIAIFQVDDIVTAESYSDNWIFHVVHTTEVIKDMRPLIQAMGLEKWAGNTSKSEVYAVHPGSAGWVLTLAKLSLFVPSHMLNSPTMSAKDRPLLLHMRDAQTMIFAHPEPLKEYLQAGGVIKPNPQNLTANKGDPNADPFKPQPFLTIDPGLREMLMRVQNQKDPLKVLCCSAADLRAVETGGKHIIRSAPLWDVANLIDNKGARVQYVGMALATKDSTHHTFINSLKCKNTDASQQLKDELYYDVGPPVVEFFGKVASHKVELVDGDPPPPPDPVKSAQPGQPPGEPKPQPKPLPKDDPLGSFIKVSRDARIADFVLNLVLTGKAAANMDVAVQLMAAGIRGEAEIASGKDYRFPLASAGKLLGEKGLKRPSQPGVVVPSGTFPPGAFPRQTGEMWNAREPNQRVSWMAGLLPYLGHDMLFGKIHFDKSWRDGLNWLPARTTVPQFLDPTFPLYSRFTAYPNMPIGCATTHYVGIAGVGLDAADAQAGDANMAGRLGVFGYNRMTSLEYIKDKGRGASNTVLMIRVPYDGPAGATPWMAGGGSTVRSVPNEKSINPFLSPSGGNDAGTYVVMVDGSVRFLKKGMSDAAFKAICAIGTPGEDDAKFNTEYPPLTPPKEVERPLGKEPVPVGKGSGSGGSKGEGAFVPLGWKVFTHKEGGFNIAMPSTAGPHTVPLGAGSIEGFRHLELNEPTKAAYTALTSTLTAVGESKSEPAQVFEKMKMSITVAGKIAGEKDIKVNNLEGREITIISESPPQQAVAIVRILLANERVYVLTLTMPGVTQNSSEYKAFFGSFKLTSAK